MDSLMEKIEKMRPWIGGVIFLLIFIVYFLVLNGSSFSAQVADNVLRPLLGSKQTITLESWYFAFGDRVKQIEYVFVKPKVNAFNASATKNISSKNASVDNDFMNLTAIPHDAKLAPIPDEGIWQGISEPLFPNQLVMAKTFVRPDPTRDYAIASLVKINMKGLALGIQAGTYYPGGTHHIFGPGIVPKDIQTSNALVAVFNGGFMERDGHYGMMVGNKVYVPLRDNLATLVVTSDGTPKIIDYTGQTFGKDVVGVRQNGAFLVRNGAVVPFVENGVDTWGRTTTNSMYTWRSGIGVTKNGDLIYAVGNSLVPQTLAIALKDAGAQDAMQLDINPYWVRFILYYPKGQGNYSYFPLLSDMQNVGSAYLHGNNKDFFYLYKKS